MARQVKGTHKPKLRVGNLHGRTAMHGPTAHLHGRQASKKTIFNKALTGGAPHPNRILNPHGKRKTAHIKTATHPPHPVP